MFVAILIKLISWKTIIYTKKLSNDKMIHMIKAAQNFTEVEVVGHHLTRALMFLTNILKAIKDRKKFKMILM